MSRDKVNPLGLLLPAGMWLTLGLLPIWTGVPEIRQAFGVDGVAGTATVERCVDYGGSGKSGRTDCRGWFTADGTEERIRVELPPESDEGETFPAHLKDGWARPSDTKGRIGSLALPALGVFLLLPIPWGLALLLLGRRPGRAAWIVLGILAAAAAALCVAGLVASSL